MKEDKYRNRMDAADHEKRHHKTLSLILAGVCCILAVAVLLATNSTRVVVVPPEIEKEFWVDSDQVSKEYLEQMGYFIAQLELNVSPASHEYQSNILLRYAHPSVHGQMQTDLAVERQRMAQDNMATSFSPRSMNIDAPRLRMTLNGKLTTMMGDKVALQEDKLYFIEFNYTGGRLYLKTFKAVDYDPLSATPQQATAPSSSS